MQNYMDRNFLEEIDDEAPMLIVVPDKGELSGFSLKTAAAMLANEPKPPIKIILPAQKLCLVFDRDIFALYSRDEIPLERLIELFICDEVYTNELEVSAMFGQVDPGSLWMRRLEEMTLVSQEEFVTTMYSPQIFKIA